MKNKLTNTRVVNSIGIGILAMVTAGTPVLAAINGAMNDNGTADSNVSDIPAEPVDQAAPSQNEQILQTLSDTQATIQTVQDGSSQQGVDFTGNPEETGDNAGGNRQEVTPPDQQPTADSEGALDESQPAEPSDTQQPSIEAEGQNGENIPQTPPEEVTPVEAKVGTTDVTSENVNILQSNGESGIGAEVKREEDPTIHESLEEAKGAIGDIKEDIIKLDTKNKEAADAIDNYKEAVANPNNFIGSIADSISDASSAVVDAVESVTEDEMTAREQAQIAVDVQTVGYATREEAMAAQQQAQEAAAAAEDAYRSAQASVEEAENNKRIADENLSELKRQKDTAEAALEEMNAKVQGAQDMLRIILESNGFSVEDLSTGRFDPNQLEGDAKAAYESAANALKKAEEDLRTAQSNYASAAESVGAAEESFVAAETTLNGLITNLNDAEDEANRKINELDQENYNAIYTEYIQNNQEAEQTKLDFEKAQAALKEAEEALKKAQEVKDKTHDVIVNAQAAVSKANDKENEAKQAADKAKKAVKDNEDNIEQALEVAKSAEEKVKEAAAEANRAAQCLQSVIDAAEEAEKNLAAAQEAKDAASADYSEKKEAYDTAKAVLKEARETLLGANTVNVLKAQEAAESGGEAEDLALAEALIRYVTCKADAVKEIGVILDPQRKWNIQVYYSGGRMETYCYSRTEKGLEISKGTEYFYSEYDFNQSMERDEGLQPELSEKRQAFDRAQSDFITAQQTLKDAENRVRAAEEERNSAVEQAAIVEALKGVAEALDKVCTNAAALVKAEEDYQKDYREKSNNIIAKLDNLLSKGTDLKKANDKLAEVNRAKTEVDNAIRSLTELAAQENADQSAYKNLVDTYNSAKADYDEAVDALEECVASLNRAETEKDRARAAADSIFRYIVQDNTTTPVQPVTPIRPVYGTLIDTITSPIIGNTGVSTPSGTGYTGYAYTIGGQPVYAVGETAEPEGEAPEENLVNVEDSAVPLAQVGETNKNKTNNTKTTRTVKDEKVPLADVETEKSKYSWLWILVIALLGATGTELYIRHKEKTEQEEKSKSNKQSYAKI